MSEYETESEAEEKKQEAKKPKGPSQTSIFWRRFRTRFNTKEAKNRLKKVKEGMSQESKIRRYMIIGFASAAAVFCFSISIYWMARADSANRYEADADMLRGSDN